MSPSGPSFSLTTGLNKEQIELIQKNCLKKAGRKFDIWLERQKTGDYSGGSPMSEDGELPAGAEVVPGEFCWSFMSKYLDLS
jgi:hypothetical protein